MSNFLTMISGNQATPDWGSFSCFGSLAFSEAFSGSRDPRHSHAKHGIDAERGNETSPPDTKNTTNHLILNSHVSIF
jgi:hypothetical protein